GSPGRRADRLPSPRRSLADSLRRFGFQLTEIVRGDRYGAAMAKSSAGSSGFRCTECGWQSAKWTGRCGECQAWGTVLEAMLPRQARGVRVRAVGGIRSAVHSVAPASTTPLPIGQVDATDATARPSGMDELDRV